jgi:malyl-CoA/(S)-citramalyl-CoA lyase
MSFTAVEPARWRLQRSTLAVPGVRADMMAKAFKTAADCVLLDLEDAVAPDDKAAARAQVIRAVLDHDWRAAGKTVMVRVNGLDTPWFARDVMEVMAQAGPRVDTLLVPKVGVPEDLYVADALMRQVELEHGWAPTVGIEVLIETALGMANVEAIAKYPRRLEALHFGVGDYAASVRARMVNIGGLSPDYPGDQWHAALSRMTVAARAAGKRAIDGPYGNFHDPEGFRASCRRDAALGIEGKWAIHPSQVALANEEFTPPSDDVARARRILVALEEAAAAGRGAAQLDGRMIDAASARMAGQLVATADAIAAATPPGAA